MENAKVTKLRRNIPVVQRKASITKLTETIDASITVGQVRGSNEAVKSRDRSEELPID